MSTAFTTVKIATFAPMPRASVNTAADVKPGRRINARTANLKSFNNPIIIFVRLGSNDAGAPSGYRYNMKQVVETSIANGVIPVLVTKADRFEGPDNINNNILRELAAEFNVPLLEFDIIAETLPNRGLKANDVHMEELIGPHDFTLPETMQSGHAIHDLIALMMLDAIWQETNN